MKQKKLTVSTLKSVAFADKLNKSVIKWIVENQAQLREQYKTSLKHDSNNVTFSLDLRTITGARIGLTVRESGDYNFRLYESPKKALNWFALQDMGCPSFTK